MGSGLSGITEVPKYKKYEKQSSVIIIFELYNVHVCLYAINVKAAKPIGLKFFCGNLNEYQEDLWTA